MTQEKTPWFQRHVVPSRSGLYERKYGNSVLMDFWDGECWSVPRDRALVIFSSLPWRGLAQDPEAKG